MDLRQLDAPRFAQHLHTRFAIQVPGFQPVPAELVEVTELKDTPKQEQFSLIFHVENAAPLPQGTYELRHDALGEIHIFLVAIGPRNGQGMDYQAVFNRFKKDAGSAA